jgi:uncharacterized membrane protein YbaN (DUF454 family)
MNLKKIIFLMIGCIALLLGTIGIFLPILPTTPFVLLAGACFSVSSPRLSALLSRNKYFGSYLDNYHNNTGVPRKVKYRAITFLWTGLIISMLLVGKWPMVIIFSLIGIGVTIHLISLKNRD